MAVISHVKWDYPIKKALYPLSLLLGVPKVETTYTKSTLETIFQLLTFTFDPFINVKSGYLTTKALCLILFSIITDSKAEITAVAVALFFILFLLGQLQKCGLDMSQKSSFTCTGQLEMKKTKSEKSSKLRKYKNGFVEQISKDLKETNNQWDFRLINCQNYYAGLNICIHTVIFSSPSDNSGKVSVEYTFQRGFCTSIRILTFGEYAFVCLFVCLCS